MYQQMWSENTDWDEPISQPLQSQWNSYQAQLQTINSVEIPRWFHTDANSNIQLV